MGDHLRAGKPPQCIIKPPTPPMPAHPQPNAMDTVRQICQSLRNCVYQLTNSYVVELRLSNHVLHALLFHSIKAVQSQTPHTLTSAASTLHILIGLQFNSVVSVTHMLAGVLTCLDLVNIV